MSVQPIASPAAQGARDTQVAGHNRLIRTWYVTIPRALDPISPSAADAFSDGAWTAAWRSVGAILPPISFAIGFFAPLLWPGMTTVFSESLVFLIVTVVLSFISGPAGVFLLAGYAGGDILHDIAQFRMSTGFALVGAQLAANVVSYLLMGVAVVVIPQASRRLAAELSAKIRDEHFSGAAQASLSAIAAAMLVYLWCQATIVLIRPVFTWVGRSPETAAVEQVQLRWLILVTAAMAAVLIRAIGELIASHRASWTVVNALNEERWSAPERRGTVWNRLPSPIRILVAAFAVTLLLAGTYVTWLDAGLVFFSVVVLKAWRSGMLGSMPRGWVAAMTAIPALVRFALAPLIGFVAGWAVIALFWRAGSLRPVMFGAFFTLIVFHLLFPPRRREANREQAK